MENLSFRPRKNEASTDAVSSLFIKASRIVFIFVLGIFPIFFVPLANAPLNFTKSLFVIAGLVIILMLQTFLILRRGSLTVSAPPALYVFWVLVTVCIASALYSGDIKDALLGDMFGVYTAGFMFFMATIMSVTYVLGASKVVLRGLCLSIVGSGTVLALFHLFRAFFGTDFFTFSIFNSAFSSPYGMWNEVAIFFGLIVISGLILIRQMLLTRASIAIVTIITALSLMMLVVVNFYTVWVLLAIISLLLLIQILVDTHQQSESALRFVKPDEENQTISVVYTMVVFVVALLFVVFNSTFSTAINSYTESRYLEMRPSASSTFNVMKQVLYADPLLGIGPNKFIDGWRLYKDPAVNETEFWDTSFAGGNGLVSTSMATTGALGILFWLVFLGMFIWHGFRFISCPLPVNKFWHIVGALAFVASVYLWITALIYLPSVPTMIVLAVTTGVFFSAYGVLRPVNKLHISLFDKPVKKIVAVCVAIAVLCGMMVSLFVIVKQYGVVYEYTSLLNMGKEIDRKEKRERIGVLYDRSPNDVFARQVASALLFSLDGMLKNTELIDEGKLAHFQDIAVQAIQAGQLATKTDPTEPLNWVTLGQLYSILTLAQIDGAYKMGMQAYDIAQELDPHNPGILLLKSQLESRNKDFDTARSLAAEAIDMKSNYTDAFFFLAQLDIVEGKIADAIEKSRMIVSVDPLNPRWLYQLGTLYLSTGDYTAAITVFEQTLVLDSEFANARYFLALLLAESGNFDEALVQMLEVERTNPDNTFVKEALEAFKNRQTITLPNSPTAPITEVVEGGDLTIDEFESDEATMPESESNSGDSL